MKKNSSRWIIFFEFIFRTLRRKMDFIYWWLGFWTVENRNGSSLYNSAWWSAWIYYIIHGRGGGVRLSCVCVCVMSINNKTCVAKVLFNIFGLSIINLNHRWMFIFCMKKMQSVLVVNKCLNVTMDAVLRCDGTPKKKNTHPSIIDTGWRTLEKQHLMATHIFFLLILFFFLTAPHFCLLTASFASCSNGIHELWVRVGNTALANTAEQTLSGIEIVVRHTQLRDQRLAETHSWGEWCACRY